MSTKINRQTQVKCPKCGLPARGPQGLAAHVKHCSGDPKLEAAKAERRKKYDPAAYQRAKALKLQQAAEAAPTPRLKPSTTQINYCPKCGHNLVPHYVAATMH